jgi:hypothetical protein
MTTSILDLVWDEMQAIAKKSDANIAKLHGITEQSGFTDGIPAATFATLPTTGLGNNTSYATVWFCSNGRKSGEGVGTGTGVPVYWNTATSQWLKFSDDSVVTV